MACETVSPRRAWRSSSPRFQRLAALTPVSRCRQESHAGVHVAWHLAGNASQVSDGAAAVLLARRSAAKRLGLPVIAKFVSAAVVGVPPKIMGYVLQLSFIISCSFAIAHPGLHFALPFYMHLSIARDALDGLCSIVSAPRTLSRVCSSRLACSSLTSTSLRSMRPSQAR